MPSAAVWPAAVKCNFGGVFVLFLTAAIMRLRVAALIIQTSLLHLRFHSVCVTTTKNFVVSKVAPLNLQVNKTVLLARGILSDRWGYSGGSFLFFIVFFWSPSSCRIIVCSLMIPSNYFTLIIYFPVLFFMSLELRMVFDIGHFSLCFNNCNYSMLTVWVFPCVLSNTFYH